MPSLCRCRFRLTSNADFPRPYLGVDDCFRLKIYMRDCSFSKIYKKMRDFLVKTTTWTSKQQRRREAIRDKDYRPASSISTAAGLDPLLLDPR
jgi:hypothetical protein